MYPADARSAPVRLLFTNVPSNWQIASTLAESPKNEYEAANYDLLVDAPVEIGTFRERDFDQGGGHYRVVVDADPADYDMEKLVPTIRNIVTAATAWMNDRPFHNYLFLYHFPRGPGGGGMEQQLQHGDRTLTRACLPTTTGVCRRDRARIFPLMEREAYLATVARSRGLHQRKLQQRIVVQRRRYQHGAGLRLSSGWLAR